MFKHDQKCFNISDSFLKVSRLPWDPFHYWEAVGDCGRGDSLSFLKTAAGGKTILVGQFSEMKGIPTVSWPTRASPHLKKLLPGDREDWKCFNF